MVPAPRPSGTGSKSDGIEIDAPRSSRRRSLLSYRIFRDIILLNSCAKRRAQPSLEALLLTTILASPSDATIPSGCRTHDDSRYQNSLISISGTALSARKPISGTVSVQSNSFHIQNLQRLAGFSCKRELYAWYYSSRLSKFDCSRMLHMTQR
jgi:hypothetical protein